MRGEDNVVKYGSREAPKKKTIISGIREWEKKKKAKQHFHYITAWRLFFFQVRRFSHRIELEQEIKARFRLSTCIVGSSFCVFRFFLVEPRDPCEIIQKSPISSGETL